MSDSVKKYYYTDEEGEAKWLTWEELHTKGYTLTLPNILNVCTRTFNPKQVIQCKDDQDYDKIYDADNHTWVSTLSELSTPLYKSVNSVTLYMCEQPFTYDGYTDIVNNDIPKFVNYYSELTSLDELYTTQGLTQYKCIPFIVNNGEIIAWYDQIEELYWDNRDQYKKWTSIAPKPVTQAVDVSDFDILNIDMRPALVMYSLTKEQLSNIKFMRFGVDVGLNFIDDQQDYDVLNIPIEISLKMYNVNQPLQLLHIRI